VGTLITGVNTPGDTSEQSAALKNRPDRKCQGAMSQQGFGAHGNECYPQKLVQLVGYRDPDTRMESWDRLKLKIAVREGAK
jgi:hypothetical protein